jgi:hypothetical protein
MEGYKQVGGYKPFPWRGRHEFEPEGKHFVPVKPCTRGGPSSKHRIKLFFVFVFLGEE